MSESWRRSFPTPILICGKLYIYHTMKCKPVKLGMNLGSLFNRIPCTYQLSCFLIKEKLQKIYQQKVQAVCS
jgi:hypothetical protein